MKVPPFPNLFILVRTLNLHAQLRSININFIDYAMHGYKQIPFNHVRNMHKIVHLESEWSMGVQFPVKVNQ